MLSPDNPEAIRRLAVIGNSGSGKSVLSRAIAASAGLPLLELDRILWQPGWQLAPVEEYEREHQRVLATDRWLIDGLGRRETLEARLARATGVILVDMPLWMHFWLAAERHRAWSAGILADPPAGIAQAPPLEALFRTIWDVDRDWMPGIRRCVDDAEAAGKWVHRIRSVAELSAARPRQSGWTTPR